MVPKKISEILSALSEPPSLLEITRAIKHLREINAEKARLKPLKLAVVGSFTFDTLIDPLVVRGYQDGFELSTYNAPYGQYIQELIDPSSGLHKFKPDVVYLAIRLQEVCPDLYFKFNALDANGVDSLVDQWKKEFIEILETFRSLSDSLILCSNYELPAYPSLGLADARSEPSQTATITCLNSWLHGLCDDIDRFAIVDIDGLAARCGRDRWTDPKIWFWSRSSVAPCFAWDYSGELVRLLRATTGKSRKVLALDCDNTLWGGILGEVGSSSIALGHDYPGNAYVAMQKRVLELYNRGIVLVIASKNEHSAVMDVFSNHPEMILKPEHIAYFGVNWEPKSDNLQRAAEVLNLGIDSFVFVDDNPVECAMVSSMLPEVKTICLPDDAAEYERTLMRLDCFDQFVVSEEDRKRGQMYRQEASRSRLRGKTRDIGTFYRDLQMTVAISKNDPESISRAAQLTQRTNQFNMTTVRRTESQLEEIMKLSNYDIYTLRLSDRFGDNGIVGLAIVEHQNTQDCIETFIMSCRVLGRTVETSFLSWIAGETLKRGFSRLSALYQQTDKNKHFSEFYGSWGMRCKDRQSKDCVRRWEYDLVQGADEMNIPSWINVEVLT